MLTSWYENYNYFKSLLVSGPKSYIYSDVLKFLSSEIKYRVNSWTYFFLDIFNILLSEICYLPYWTDIKQHLSQVISKCAEFINEFALI